MGMLYSVKNKTKADRAKGQAYTLTAYENKKSTPSEGSIIQTS